MLYTRHVVLCGLLMSAAGAGATASSSVKRSPLSSRSLQVADFRWTTEHHDARNSGNTNGEFGPGEASGTCPDPLIENFASTGFRFLSAGITSVGNGWWFGADTQNTLWMVEDFLGMDLVNSLNLTDFFQTTPLTPYGVVSAPATLFWPDTSGNALYLGSADGHLYAMNQVDCWQASQAASDAGQFVPPADMVRAPDSVNAAPLLAGEEELRATIYYPRSRVNSGRALQPIPTCALWSASFANPIYSSTRIIEPSPGFNATVMIVAIETDALLDTGAVAHAFAYDSGRELWQYPLTWNGNSYGSKGMLPAVNPINNVVMFFAYGPRVVALRADTQEECADFIIDMGQGSDVFASSPVLTSTGQNLYVHTALSYLYNFAITGDCVNSTMTISLVWACQYSPGGVDLCDEGLADIAQREHKRYVRNSDGSLDRSRTQTLRASDITHGGFYQLTTNQEKQELYDAIRSAYAETFPLEAAAEAEAALTKFLLPRIWNGEIITDPALDVALMARKLGADALARIVTPSGYRMLAASGRPVQPLDDGPFGVYPYSTPALSATESYVAVANFDVNQDSALYVVDVSMGFVFWEFSSYSGQGGRNVPFGRSRSSPAIDNQDIVYIASDVDWDGANDNDTLPVFFALADGSVKWAYALSPQETELSSVGACSPIVGDGSEGDHRAYYVSEDGVVILLEGYGCPSDDPVIPCFGRGDCDCNSGQCMCSDPCTTGPNCDQPLCNEDHGICIVDAGVATCMCDACWEGSLSCSLPVLCDAFATCSEEAGGCVCDMCYLPDANSTCTIVNDCGGHGVCSPVDGSCSCDFCWSKDSNGLCTIPNDCAGNGQCNPVDGTCACNNCWSQDTYGNCTVQNTCNGNGQCQAASGQCTCNSACYTGNQCEAVNTCNGNGQCNAIDGTCTCQPCFTGAQCDSELNCNYGACNSATNTCSCPAGYDPTSNCAACDMCHSNPVGGCGTVTNTCSNHGVCNGTDGSCACSGGYSGSTCAVAPASGDNTVAIAAGVGVPVGLLGAAGLGFFVFKAFFAGGAGVAHLPAPVAKILGKAAYSKLSTSAAGGASAPKTVFSISKTAGTGGSEALKAVDKLKSLAGAGKSAGASASKGLLSGTKAGGYGSAPTQL